MTERREGLGGREWPEGLEGRERPAGRRPVRVLELRSVRGTGGGPEKTIMLGAARADRTRYEITVCYIRDQRDEVFALDRRAAAVGVDYVEIYEKHSFDVGIWGALKRLVADRHIDIVHAHEYKTDLLALLLARATGTIALATAHGWTGHSSRERRVYYPLDRRLLARFPRVIAVSEQIRQEIIQAGGVPERITTVLNGIDHLAFVRDVTREADARTALGFTGDDIVIGAVGRLEPQKRFDLLIDAFALVHARWPRTKLVIAGDGSLRADLDRLATARLVPGSWRLLGHCDDVSAVHHGLDILAQSSDYEGTPNAVLEAMAFETPIVATAAGGTDQLVADGVHAVVIPPGSAETLANALIGVVGDPESARARAVAARRRIEEELSFARRMQKVEALYDALVEQHGARSGAGPALRTA